MKRKTQESKQKISRGLKAYWNRRGKKQALVLAGGATLLYGAKKTTPLAKKAAIESLQKLDKKAGESLKQSVYDAVTKKGPKLSTKGSKSKSRLAEIILNSQTVKGAKEGLETGIRDRVKDEAAQVVGKYTSIPKRTTEAFKVGLNTKTANENDFFVNSGKFLGRVAGRGRDDIRKTRSILGFSFEPSDESKYPRLYEFAKRKSRKKPLSPQHKAKISQGLQEYYDTLPKKEETFLDKGEKATKSIGRLARAAKVFAEGASTASSIYDKYKTPSKKSFSENALIGLGALSVATGSLRNLGSASSSFAGAANIIHDLATGSKERRQRFKEDSLQAKRDANKTNRQIHAIRARLERSRNKQKKEELSIRSLTADKYGKLVDSSAQNKPLISKAALQNAATKAKKEGIKKDNENKDFWFL